VAHNGSQFDFPILLNALKRHDLLHILFSLNTPLLDSLKVIKQVERTHNPIKSCQRNSLPELYEFLFKKKFQAHDALEDVTALSQILFRSSLKLSQRERSQSSVSVRSFYVSLQRRQESKGWKSTLQAMPVSNSIKEKLANAGLEQSKLSEVCKKGGARGLLAILALPEQYGQISQENAKPRVSKNVKVLTKIVRSLKLAYK